MFFKKSSKELDILPPPPPFPELKAEEGAIGKSKQAKEKPIEEKIPLQKPIPKIKGKIKLKKDKKQKAKADAVLEELRKGLVKEPKHADLPKEELELDLEQDLDIPEPTKQVFDKKEAKKKAKEEKRKAREERKKQKKAEKELAKQKHMEERKRVIEEKTASETEMPLPNLEPIKKEKPSEIFKAEHEINKAIKDLKKKPKKPLFSFLKSKKEKLPKLGIKEKTIPKEEFPEKLPPLEIKEPTDEVSAIKHKIHDARSALMNFDLKKAKILYIKAMKLYQSLSPEKQALVYGQIKELYNERMHAEGLKFKQ